MVVNSPKEKASAFSNLICCDPLDPIILIKRDFMPMKLMCERAEMFERRIYDRTKAVFEYVGLSFDGSTLL